LEFNSSPLEWSKGKHIKLIFHPFIVRLLPDQASIPKYKYLTMKESTYITYGESSKLQIPGPERNYIAGTKNKKENLRDDSAWILLVLSWINTLPVRLICKSFQESEIFYPRIDSRRV
jgi:hypothetical protein